MCSFLTINIIVESKYFCVRKKWSKVLDRLYDSSWYLFYGEHPLNYGCVIIWFCHTNVRSGSTLSMKTIHTLFHLHTQIVFCFGTCSLWRKAKNWKYKEKVLTYYKDKKCFKLVFSAVPDYRLNKSSLIMMQKELNRLAMNSAHKKLAQTSMCCLWWKAETYLN